MDELSQNTYFNQLYTSETKMVSPMIIKEDDDEMSNWMSKSFPALCQLLDKVTAHIPENGGQHLNSSAVRAISELTDIFPIIDNLNTTNAPPEQYDIPIYETNDKFQYCDQSMDVTGSTFTEAKECLEPCFVPDEKISNEYNVNINLCLVQAHNHVCSTNNDNLLQLCEGHWSNVYRSIDTDVREMDAVIRNPDTNLCRDAMETSCELQLPGPYSYPTVVKNVSFASDRHSLDVLGLFLILIDTIYASSCITHVNHNSRLVPLEFSQNIVKVVSLMRRGFPEAFSDLQKLVMYSTLTSMLKRVPFRWNMFMTHVLEDLIVHPVNFINEESIEFQLLTMIVKKRAKLVIKMFSSQSASHIFDSVKHKNIMRCNFTNVYKPEIGVFLKTSAGNCKKVHRIKNIRYKVIDKVFESYLRDIFISYC